MRSPDRRPRVGQTLAAGIILLFLSLPFWKVRIIDLGVNKTPSLYSGDLYAQYYPMVEYGFASLRSGRIPLWNPYQLCGEPFLAMAPYVGLFYPLNLPFLFFNTGAAIEVTLILHMFLGALGMWLLLRHFGISAVGAVCAGLTFVWSGWLMYNVNQPGLYSGMTWMPLTVLLFELAVRGMRRAQLGVVIAVGCQALGGAEEILLHTLYAASLFAFARLTLMAWRGEWRAAVRRAVVLAVCVAAAAPLGALQLMPTFELIGLTPRAAFSFEQVSLGSIPPRLLLEGALEIPRALQFFPIVTVGVLPLLGLTLVLGFPKHKLLWITALVAVAGSAFLALGGWAFRLYYALPVVGHLFRRPVKFLDICTFGLAVLAGVALSRLESWAALPRRRLWLHPAWLVTLALGGLAAWWAQTHIGTSLFVKGPSRYLPVMLALLVLFGLIASARWRRAVLVCIFVLQAASLFFVTGTRDLRPWRWPDCFTQYDDVLQSLRQRAGYSRAFVYGHLGPWPAGVKCEVQGKQMRNRVFVTADYDQLVASRYASFFDFAVHHQEPLEPFGSRGYSPGMSTRWKLMDLTGTKYFLAYRGGLDDAFLRGSGALTHGVLSFRLIRDGFVRIYEKENVLPRAYFVSRAHTLSSPDAVLAALDSPSFDPWLEVLLEEPESQPLPPAAEARAAVQITRYEPERVEIEADASAPGYLVLTDLHYPGWRAFVNGREVPIFRANYLFRAVRLEPGHSVVRFEYQPRSFWLGLLVTCGTGAALVLIVVWKYRTLGEERAASALAA